MSNIERIYWVSVKDYKPPCSSNPDILGTEVLIWPRDISHAGTSDNATAFYGRRVTGRPEFYKYGAIINGITHWAYLPEGPN